MIKNDLSLRFSIWDFEDTTCDEITESLNLKPFKTYRKGIRVNEKSHKLSERNGWIYGTPYHNENDFNQQMKMILDALEPKLNILKGYSKKYYCEFSCALFLNNREESVPWIHLDKRYMSFIREVDVEFDFDIYYPPLE